MDLMRYDEFSAGPDDREKFFESFEVSTDQTSDCIPFDRWLPERVSVITPSASSVITLPPHHPQPLLPP